MSGTTDRAPAHEHQDGAPSGGPVEPGSDAMIRAMVETSVNPYVVLDRDGFVVWASDRVRTLLGGDASSYIGRHFLEMIDPSSHEAALAEHVQFMGRAAQRQPWLGPPLVLELLHEDGGRVTCEVSAASATELGLEGIIVQVRRWRGTVLLYAAVDALAAGAPLDTVLRALAAIVEHDMPGSAVFVAAGWDGHRFELVEPAPETAPVPEPLAEVLATTAPGQDLQASEDGEGAGAPSGWSIAVTVRGDPAPTAAVVVLPAIPGPPPSHSTTVRRVGTLVALAIESDRNRRAWRRSAVTDHLTDLPNRTGLEEWLSRRAATAPDAPIAVLFCDVDGFKQVNDELGHATGDRVLRVVAERLRRSARDDDLVARWGGDEFVVICTDPVAAERLARRLIDHVGEPIGIQEGRARIGLSIGIALGTFATPLDDLLRRSDRALLSAKGQGRNRHVVRS